MKYLASLAVFLLAALTICGRTFLRQGETMKPGNVAKGSYIVDVTASVKSNRQVQGIGKASWGVTWNDSTGNPYLLKLLWGNTDLGGMNDERFMLVRFMIADTIVEEQRLTEGIDLHKGPNTIKLSIGDDGEMRWNIGSTALALTGTYFLTSMPVDSTLRIFAEGSDIEVNRSVVTLLPVSPMASMTPFKSYDDFPSPRNRSLSPQGVWTFLDRDNDPRWARPGGRYTLGIAPSTDDEETWEIIYLEGAVTNASRWKPGMKKGRMLPTPFVRHYHLEWIDALFDSLDRSQECSATMSDDGEILTLSFPLDHSTMRFYRQN